MLQDQLRIGGALYVLRLLARKYEFRDEEDRAPLEAIVNTTFPLLLPIFKVQIGGGCPVGGQWRWTCTGVVTAL